MAVFSQPTVPWPTIATQIFPSLSPSSLSPSSLSLSLPLSLSPPDLSASSPRASWTAPFEAEEGAGRDAHRMEPTHLLRHFRQRSALGSGSD